MPMTVPELLNWLEDTAAKAERAKLPDVHANLTMSADLIRKAYSVRAIAETADAQSSAA